MITLKPMTETTFEEFKRISHESFAKNLSFIEDVSITEGLKNAREQFSRLVPYGLKTQDQYFFDVVEEQSDERVGYLWFGVQNRFGRKVLSINDISIIEGQRRLGFGKALMKRIEVEAKNFKAKRIRLHVFQHNKPAQKLYMSMGFQISSVDMFKLISLN